MSIFTRWLNTEREVILWEIEGSWSLDEMRRAHDYAHTLAVSHDHVSYEVIDLSATNYAPLGMTDTASDLWSRNFDRMDMRIFVTRHPMFRSLVASLNQKPGLRGRFVAVETMAEAETLIAARQRATSLAAAGT